MNKKKIIIILLLSSVIVFAVIGYFIFKKESKCQLEFLSSHAQSYDIKEIEYELIMNDFFFETKIFKPNAALLLSDEEEIKADAEMFLAKTESAHLCGYNYRISFWTNTNKLFGGRSVNETCEIFGYKHEKARKKLAYYIKQLETAPTHYIYSLEIPVSMEPNDIREKLKDSKLKLFFIQGEKKRLPSIRFWLYIEIANSGGREKVKEASKKIFQEIVEKIKSVSSVVNESDIFYSLSGSRDNYEYREGSVKLTFEKGADLSNAVRILEEEGAKTVKIHNPSTYYVQVVDTSANLEYIKEILKPYEFIKEITEYTEEN